MKSAPEGVSIGSIGGGGRYDDLTGLFGVPDIPGVGISFGVDRIYDVMEELKLFPATVQCSTEFLFFNLAPEAACKSFDTDAEQLRDANSAAKSIHEQSKFDKQFKYAEKKHIPFVIIIGTEELNSRKSQSKKSFYRSSGGMRVWGLGCVREEIENGKLKVAIAAIQIRIQAQTTHFQFSISPMSIPSKTTAAPCPTPTHIVASP